MLEETAQHPGGSRDPVEPRPSGRSTGSVDIGTVIDVDDSDREVGSVDFIDNSIGAHSRRVHPQEVASKWFPDPMGVGQEGTDKEVEDRDRDLVG